MKIIDKASWHIDNGIGTSIVVGHFKRIFAWLAANDMLTDEGKELWEAGIDESISLHGRLVTPDAQDFLENEYDKFMKVNLYGEDKSLPALESLYSNYRQNK